MRAAQVTRLDGPEAVEVVDLPHPTDDGDHPADRMVLVDVAAAGVCFPDVLLTRGLYQMRPDPPFVPGSEVYESTIEVDFAAVGDEARMVVTIHPHLDPHWTKMAVQGFRSQLAKLDRRFGWTGD